MRSTEENKWVQKAIGVGLGIVAAQTAIVAAVKAIRDYETFRPNHIPDYLRYGLMDVLQRDATLLPPAYALLQMAKTHNNTDKH